MQKSLLSITGFFAKVTSITFLVAKELPEPAPSFDFVSVPVASVPVPVPSEPVRVFRFLLLYRFRLRCTICRSSTPIW